MKAEDKQIKEKSNYRYGAVEHGVCVHREGEDQVLTETKTKQKKPQKISKYKTTTTFDW